MKIKWMIILGSVLNLPIALGQVVKWEMVVKEIRGTVNFGRRALPRKTVIRDRGIVKTGKGSFVKIEMRSINAQIVLGPLSSIQVDFSTLAEKKINLLEGSLRWKSLQSPEEKENRVKSLRGILYTPLASLAIRGTDFFVKVNKVLNETEIFVLDGRVKFQNLKNKGDFLFLQPGHWAGLGGRFRNSIGSHLDLPEKARSYYMKLLEF